MDMNDTEKSKQESLNSELETSELLKVHNTPLISTLDLNGAEVSEANIILQNDQNVIEDLEKQNISKNRTISSTSHMENSDGVDVQNIKNGQNNEIYQKNSLVLNVNPLNDMEERIKETTGNGKSTVAVVKALKPLCADYKSSSDSSDSESVDSESDSSTVSAYSTTDTSSGDEYSSDESCDSNTNEKEKKLKETKLIKDLSLCDLPPIEDLKISVSENECVEIGTITSIVETLVVVESYRGTAALDLDTVLFLDGGKRTLGKVFDILGPVTEPVYTIRFNSQEQINNLNIEKNLKVYYAPKTHHTSYVFMSEVLKNRGSDASWKDNTEAPSEFQDFSDDEQERIHKKKQVRETVGENLSPKEPTSSKKRPFNKVKPSSDVFQTGGFRNPNFCWQRRTNVQRNPSGSQSVPPLPRSPAGHPNSFESVQTPSFSHNVPHHPSVNAGPMPPRFCFPSRFSGPPFPAFGSFPLFNQNQNFQHPFYQQRTHGYLQTVGSWGRPPNPMFRYHLPPLPPPPPPPPPPPAADQGDHRP